VGVALVTGAGGFAGSHLVASLLADGWAVHGTTLDGRPPAAVVLMAHELERVRWIGVDVTSLDSVRDAMDASRPDVVFHLAGQASVGGSFGDIHGTWEANATGTLNVVLGARDAAPGATVLVVSSAEVYGAVPRADQPIIETRALAPANPYGASKAAAEIVAGEAVRSHGQRVVIARSFNHTGPGQSTRFALPSWAAQLRRIASGEAEPVIRVGNLDVQRDLLDVRDVVRAYRMLAEHAEPGEVFNVASGRPTLMREAVEGLVELSRTDARIVVDPARVRPVDAPLIVGDATRLRSLGWAPEIELRTTLADLLASAPVE
jgi:GDP-4-dehydro-6-deoxy-D-mannose reductase